MTLTVERIAPRENTYQVPELAPNEQGWFRLTPPGGTIQPMQAAPGVRTVGKLEVMVHPEKDLPLVDGRTRDFYVVSTIPSAKSSPYPDVVERIDELDRERPSISFCNGPQCGQSPTAIRDLLAAGFPADKILYYRGGLHDWRTLGLSVVAGE